MNAVQHHRQFEDFIKENNKKIDYFCHRYRLESAEVVSCAYITWERLQRGQFKKDHPSGASFATYMFTCLETDIRSQFGGHMVALDDINSEIDLVESSANSSDSAIFACQNLAAGKSFDEMAVDGFNFYEMANHQALVNYEAEAVEDKIEAMLTRAYADVALEDVIRSHPVYAHPTYRTVIDGLLQGQSTSSIAKRSGYTERLIRGAFTEILEVLERKDPILDNRLIKLKDGESIDADPVRYREIDSLIFVIPDDLNRARVIEIASSLLDCPMYEPIIIDQFNRVLKGVTKLVAAKVVGIQYVKTMICAITEGDESRSAGALERKRAQVKGENSRPLTLIDHFKQLVDEGAISELVGARLSYLPASAQYLMLTVLGSLIPRMLTMREANRIVLAFSNGTLQSELVRLREVVRNKIGSLK